MESQKNMYKETIVKCFGKYSSIMSWKFLEDVLKQHRGENNRGMPKVFTQNIFQKQSQNQILEKKVLK